MPTGPVKPGPSKQEPISQAVKLPEFMPSALLVWWLACESAFEIRNISCHVQKYHFLIAALPADVTTKVLHVLRAGLRSGTKDEDPRYGLLKTAIIQLFAPSKYDAFTQFLDMSRCSPRRSQATSSQSFVPPCLLSWTTVSAPCGS